MDSFYRPTRVEISLDALNHNLSAFREALPDEMHMMAVIKANAYGHGAIEVAREAIRCGVRYLGVAFLDEAMELRAAGIEAPILVLGYTPPEGLALARQHGITVTAYSDDILEALLSSAADDSQLDQPVLKLHIKVDSGMGRIGVQAGPQAVQFIERMLSVPQVEVEGVFTHYACADEEDKSYTMEQYSRFDTVIEHFRTRGIQFPLIHAGNSAGAIDVPELSYNMVRLGIGMYGLYPSEEVNRKRVELRPVMSIKTAVVMIKSLPPDSGVSYGVIYRTRGEEQVATLPIGYADGYTRMLTGKAHALIHGQRVPVIGKICMDQCIINVTDVPQKVQLGDEVVLIGEQQGSRITADELAEALGTINYEITCMVSSRVARVYLRHGETVSVTNRLFHEHESE